MSIAPPCTPPEELERALERQGFAVVGAAGVRALAGASASAFAALSSSWERLPPDTYLRDGGRYRRRRHSCFTVEGARVHLEPHRAHWQPVEYNALHGGMLRWFEPLEPELLSAVLWPRLLGALCARCDALRGPRRWFVEAHQFRIDTTDGIGRPTPEGAHRDGVDFVAILLVARHGIKGGETRVFEASGPQGVRFTLSEPWSLLMLDDARVVHETTPIQPVSEHGHRDTLVVTIRSGGFQGPGA